MNDPQVSEILKPPQPMTLGALQDYVAQVVKQRGFTSDLNEIFILMVEELGELATEFKHLIYYPERFDKRNLGFELADILMYLLDLANGFQVDLATLWPIHEEENDQRFAKRRQGQPPAAPMRPDLPLNSLVRHVDLKRAERNFEDTTERLMILLTEEVGEISAELRKHWKGISDAQRIGREMIDALTYLFRLAHVFEINLEGALAEKEKENADRVWTY